MDSERDRRGLSREGVRGRWTAVFGRIRRGQVSAELEVPIHLGREAREVHQDRLPHGREGVGLGKDVTFHSRRHTFASWYMMQGGGLYRPRLRPARRPETPMRDTPILILDEATAGLEAASQQAVIGAMDALMKGSTSVVIAHHPGTIRHADVILVIKDSALVEHGTHEALLAQNGVYAEMQRIQAPEGAKISTTQPSRD